MEDKIVEVFKKYSKSVDTEYNVYNCLIEEDWSNIAQELVKLFCQPAVIESLPEHECKYCGAMTTQPDEECYRAPVNSGNVR